MLTQIQVRFYELACRFFRTMTDAAEASEKSEKKDVWEQRRFELTKDILTSLINSERFNTWSCNELMPKAIELADEIITQLKDNKQ